MYWGIILFPLGIALAFIVYLLAYDHLFRIFASENDAGPLIANKSTQEKMGVTAFLFICLLTIAINRIVTNLSIPITSNVTKKVRFQGAKESCNELILADGSKHCVNIACWNAASVGKDVTLKPQTGLLGLRRKDIKCEG